MQVYEAPLRDMRFVLEELHRDDGFGDRSVVGIRENIANKRLIDLQLIERKLFQIRQR